MATTYIPVVILVFLSSFCTSDDHLSQARSLSPGENLISDGGAFALGFVSLANSNNLYIGIWYRNIPERTVVWVTNRASPFITPSSTKLVITNSSELALLDSDGRFLCTNNVASTDDAGAVAVLLNSGNFVLRSSNGTEICQSFNHPTDTILPTMRLLVSYKDRVTSLAAWKGPDDPSTDEFSCSVDPSSDLQLFIWRGSQPYYRTTVLSGISMSGDTSRSNTDFIMYETVVNTRDIFYFNYTVSDGARTLY